MIFSCELFPLLLKFSSWAWGKWRCTKSTFSNDTSFWKTTKSPSEGQKSKDREVIKDAEQKRKENQTHDQETETINWG